MHPIKKFENSRILLLLVSFLTITALFTFSGSLVQSAFADSTYTAAGDWGCTSNTDATVSNMAGKNPERVFGLGDYSYQSTGNE